MSIEDLLHPLLGRYFAAPGWLKASVGRAYRSLPERLRLGAAYYAFRDELEATGGSAAASAALARTKLGETLDWTIRTVPQYRRFEPLLAQDLDPIELLSRMPVTDKLHIKSNLQFYLSRGVPASQRLRTETGGTTLHPLAFYLHKHVTRGKEYAFMQAFRARLGVEPGTVTLGLLGRIHRSGAADPRAPWTYEPIKRHLVFNPAHLDARHMPEFAKPLRRYRPRYIEGFASMLYPIARWLEANPLPEFTAGVKGVMLISENVHDYQLALFRRVFGCPILRHYGHSERVLMAATLPDDERYFFWPQYGWFELLDFEDRPITQPGVLGQIVGTSFDNRVMPFVRYRTGDLAVLSERGHPDLPGHLACERIDGRVQELFVDCAGRLGTLTAIGAAHFDHFSRIDAMQYEQTAPGELIQRIVAGPDFTADMERSMAEAIGHRTCCRVRVERVERIERSARGKQSLLLQKLDLAPYLKQASLN